MDLQIGEKIKALRLSSDLTQAELADRAGLTKGFISQLENEQTSIQIDSLADLLEALGVSIAGFFGDTEEKVVFAPEERVNLENKGAVSFELMIPSSTNNLMDPILLELSPGEKLDEQEPHPGEQFGFVLKGLATLKLNGKSYRVPKGHCFYFESNRSQQICNNGSSAMQLLWVTTPPQL